MLEKSCISKLARRLKNPCAFTPAECQIQEGEFEFELDREIIVASAGTFLHSPKGQLHRFTNIGSLPAKMLCWVTPAGLEKFFIEVGTMATQQSVLPPPLSPPDVEKILAAAPNYGLKIIPPAASTI